MDDLVLTELRSLRTQVTDNHVEVVQRLTALETESYGLPERVGSLEAYRNKSVGVVAAVSMLITLSTDWLLHRFSR